MHTKVGDNTWDLISDWPKDISAATDSGNGTSGITSSALTLCSNWNVDSSGSQRSFVAVVSALNDDTITRISGNTLLKLDPDGGTTDEEYAGVVYTGDYDTGTVLAGRTTGGKVYYCTNPNVTAENQVWRSARGLTGAATYLALDPDFATTNRVYASSTGAESAVSISDDGGAYFYQVGLIDTIINSIQDFATAGATTWFLATENGTTTDSIWKTVDGGASWRRVLATNLGNTPIIRLSPVYASDSTLYVGEIGSPTLYYSNTGGAKRWSTRTVPGAIADLIAEDGETSYAGVGANVRKSEDGGFTWLLLCSTGLPDGTIHTMVSIGEDKLIVGSITGYVSYSVDGNSSWTLIPEQIPGGGAAQVTASGLDNGDYIYAATDAPGDNIYRWQIGTSTSWSDIIAGTLDAGYGIYGIGLSGLTLYVMGSDGTDSRCWWTPDPTAATPEWSTIFGEDRTFDRIPQALRTGCGKLWAIDTSSHQLCSCTLTIGPTHAVPTMTLWGGIVMAGVLGLLMAYMVRRKQTAS